MPYKKGDKLKVINDFLVNEDLPPINEDDGPNCFMCEHVTYCSTNERFKDAVFHDPDGVLEFVESDKFQDDVEGVAIANFVKYLVANHTVWVAAITKHMEELIGDISGFASELAGEIIGAITEHVGESDNGKVMVVENHDPDDPYIGSKTVH